MSCRKFLIAVLVVPALMSGAISRSAKEEDPEVVEWREGELLTWDDFTGKPDAGSSYKALTSAEILFSSATYKDSAVIEITCLFIKNASWTKNRNSEKLLRHEQVHFDIAELISRKLRRECAYQRPRSSREATARFQELYNTYTGKLWDDLNGQYDKETGHSILTEKQLEWELKISEDLKQLDNYASPKVVVVF